MPFCNALTESIFLAALLNLVALLKLCLVSFVTISLSYTNLTTVQHQIHLYLAYCMLIE